MHGISPQKAQSAMEYLMTYGWAILLIAIVLAALFSLGVFSSSSLIGTTCIADSGFLCSSQVIQGTTFIATIGQSTGVQFNNAIVCFVPTSVPNPSSCSGYSSADVGTLSTGQTSTVSLLITSSSSTQDGHLWMQYGESSYSDLMSEIATVTMKGLTPSSTTALSSISYYVPIQITNTQGTAASSPFQQMITIPESTYSNYISYNGVSANFEYATSSGTVLPAWIESNNSGSIVTWVKLPNGIPANSHTTIYLEFAPKTTNLLSSSGTTGIGEAPQLSPTYAEYDDGASVFTNYWNFAGTSLTVGTQTSGGGWSTYCTNVDFCSETNYASQNNGLTITLPSGFDNYDFFWASNFSINNIFDWYGTPYTPSAHADSNGQGTNNGGWGFGLGNEGGDTGEVPGIGMGSDGVATTNYYLNSGPAANWAVNPPTKGVYSVYYYSSGSSATLNYQNIVTSTIAPSKTSYNIGWSFGYGASSGTYDIQWARVRAYPPNGLMPSATFGAVTAS